MNTLHSLVPVILVQLISQVRCVDHRHEIHKLPLRPHTLPAPDHYPHPHSANPYMNYPPPYNSYMSNPFLADPYQIPAVPQMYQPPFAPPFGFMPYAQQPAFPFAKHPGPYMPPMSYPAENQAAEPWPNSASRYMVPSSQLNYMTQLPQPSYAPNSGYTLWNPQFSPSSRYTPSPQFSFPGAPYITPNMQHPPSGYTPNVPPNYATPSPIGYFAANPQTSYVPQPNSVAPSSQTTLHTHNPQTHVSLHPTAQAIPGPVYPANRTSGGISYQPPTLADTTNITSADNFTVSIIPGIASPENVTQNLAMPLIPAPGKQPTNDFVQNPSPLVAPDTDAETKVISSNGETSTDLNSLPPQVRDFIDMIPNILAMPQSSALNPNDQLQYNSIDKPRPLPFSLHKRPKGLPFSKRKSIYPPSPYFTPAYLQPPYHKLPYQQHLPIPGY